MALLHVKLLSLRNKGIRTLSATLMVIFFFGGVFLFVLHPSHHPQEQSTLPLSADLKDVSVRALSLTALDAAEDENTSNFSVVTTTTTSTTTTTALQEKNERGSKESIINNDNASKNETDEDNNIQNKRGEKIINKDNIPKENQNTNLQEEPSIKLNSTQNKEKTEAVKRDDKPQNISEPRKEDTSLEKTPTQPHTSLPPSNLTQATANGSNPQPNLPKPGTGIISRKTRFQILGSNLEILPFQSFASPFIDYTNDDDDDDDDDEDGMEKKIITWHQPKGLADSGQRKVLREVKRQRRLLKNCRPEWRCKVVYPLPRGVRADAVVFNEVDTSVDPPARRHPDQVYILHKTRPPASRQLAAWPASWRWAFNWTWSYRQDSHIWQPLGRLKEADAVPPVDYFITLAEGKTRALAWIPRTCPILGKTPSKRNEFVQELRRYAPVTEFGSCSNKMCGRENTSCSEFLSQKFFFLLALEDDLCKDYVTEVFYRAWQEGTYVLPVVRGGADYASYFPVGTYIDADWFKTVEQLYHFLSELIADRKLYAQLLWRKSHWIKAARKTEEVALCNLCYMLHHRDDAPRNYLDAFQWSEDNGCKLQT